MSWTRGKRCSSKEGIAWELYRHKTAVFSEGLSRRQRPPSDSRYQVSHMPRRLPALLRGASPSSFVLKIILAPCFVLLDSTTPRLTCEVRTPYASVE